MYWLPLLFLYATSPRCEEAAISVYAIVSFLSNLDVILRLDRLCRQKLIWILSFVQHVHILIPQSVTTTFFPKRTSPHYSHLVSSALVKKFNKLLIPPSFGLLEIQSALKISLLLHDSSEFEDSFSLARHVFEALKKLNTASLDQATVDSLKYTALCLIFKSMNSQMILSNSVLAQQLLDEAESFLGETVQNEQKFPVSLQLPDFVHQLFLEEHRINSLRTKMAINQDQYWSLPFENERQEINEEYQTMLSIQGSISNLSHVTPSVTSAAKPQTYTHSNDASELMYTKRSHLHKHDEISTHNTAFLHIQLALYYHTMCRFKKGLYHARIGLERIQTGMGYVEQTSHPDVLIEFLRLLFKMAILKREHRISEQLMVMAIKLAKQCYSEHSLIYIRLLFEYTNILSLRDQTFNSQKLFKKVLALLMDTIPCPSTFLVQVLEDCAYVLYVLNYGTGDFKLALALANVGCICLVNLYGGGATKLKDDTTDSNKQYYNDDPFLESKFIGQATINRIRALILEEMALDDSYQERKNFCLRSAVILHLKARPVYIKVTEHEPINHSLRQNFGLFSLQTAKHFGNMGRLYQSLNNVTLAEKMHKLTIFIKELLLGPSDLDVGLSVGHLASLYTFDMQKLEEGIELHERSLRINTAFYGPAYSGHEFDYRGLQRAHTLLGQEEKADKYSNMLRDWSLLRGKIGDHYLSQSFNMNIDWMPSEETIAACGGCLTSNLFMRAFLMDFHKLSCSSLQVIEDLFANSIYDSEQLSSIKNLDSLISSILSLSDDFSVYDFNSRAHGSN
ncbi:Amyloid protein-binding protein 2 [Cichlidogyrus casuarinus]|uniref:Amyloid protein-binding protein 2 n=1 Tax=Cichlidogyrus casuarinus TaxID=1844966 RepID=A0ABD2Q1E6_9PLAT